VTEKKMLAGPINSEHDLRQDLGSSSARLISGMKFGNREERAKAYIRVRRKAFSQEPSSAS
jgi:hypothetical protein